jgi:hypothetical protein
MSGPLAGRSLVCLARLGVLVVPPFKLPMLACYNEPTKRRVGLLYGRGAPMRTLLIALGLGLGGYVLGALGGFALVTLFSSNQHDRALEAAMTAFFVTGPLVAVLAAVGGVLLRLAR